MRQNVQIRIAWAGIGLSLILTGYSIQLAYVQITKYHEFTALAAQKHSIRQILHARRGLILDANKEILAANLPLKTVVADGSLIRDANALARCAAPFLSIPVEELLPRLRTERKYVVVKRKFPEDRARALMKELRKTSLRGLSFEQELQRVYPNGELLSQVLGFLDHRGQGVQGLEASMAAYLEGKNGFRLIERDRTGREIVIYRGQEHPPRNGINIQLTIDTNLQAIVEKEVDAAYHELKASYISSVMIRPQTGEILAMANRPTFNPNSVGASTPNQLRNYAVMDMIEPGSTFKIVITSGVLNEGLVRPTSAIFCENGEFCHGGVILRDHKAYEYLSVHDTLVKSSNIGAAKLAFLLGNQRLYRYIRKFGFGDRTGVELPSEASGIIHPPHRWSKTSITRIPMGYEVAVTPLQLTVAMSAIANEGKLMAPHIVKALLDGEGRPVSTISPHFVRQVISSETAKAMGDALTEVVSHRGTAVQARVNGFEVAGKTGTAQKVDYRGGYHKGRYVASFAGFLPRKDPQFVCLVVVDDAKVPSSMAYGGLVSAPIFSRIAERTARYMGLPPLSIIKRGHPLSPLQKSQAGLNSMR
ncbi:MAG: penicillin-binding protein 2 [Candidatus Xiphinematobacter sp.]|nr:MAG: penicillin-binding protein 2 [Candidatus Xiphinematobacter sp.]